jgi:benzoate/toluate 1,2-dioxygenase reductase subunit
MSASPIHTPVLTKRRLSESVTELRIQRPPGFVFTPGQRVRIHRGDDARDYSVASAPGDAHLTICVKVFPRGRVSPHLAGVAPGDSLTISGPHGHFFFQSDALPAVFVATGTGIAPFRSMVAAGCRPNLVLHGVRSPVDRHYRVDVLAARVPYTACISDGTAAEDGDFAGRVTDYLSRQLAAGRYDFYLCGRQEMIRDATLILDDRSENARIFSEVFY